jgi:hypothetical protein
VGSAAGGGRAARGARPSRRGSAAKDGGVRRDRVLPRVGSRDRAPRAARRQDRRLPAAERKLHYYDREPRRILFVVPGDGRLKTLRCVSAPGSYDDSPAVGRWPILATSVRALRPDGPLTLRELPARSDVPATDPRLALGRCWRHAQPDFWERLSPLGPPARRGCGPSRPGRGGRARWILHRHRSPPRAQAGPRARERTARADLDRARRSAPAARREDAAGSGCRSRRRLVPRHRSGLAFVADQWPIDDPAGDVEEEPWR